MEMIIIFWYYQIFIFISIYLPYRDVDPLNQIEEILVKSMAKYFTADADHYSRFFRWNEKSANDIRSPDSVVEPHHSMHISRKGRERKSEVSGKRTNSIYMQMRSSFISSMSNRWTLVEILSWLQFRLRCTMNEPRDIGISKRCINNINNEMRILSLPRWLLRFDLDNSSKLGRKLEEFSNYASYLVPRIWNMKSQSHILDSRVPGIYSRHRKICWQIFLFLIFVSFSKNYTYEENL